MFDSNPVCALFGIRYPVIQGGMVWAAGWRLAAAVSNAGGLGLIGAGSMDAEVLRTHIRRCQEATANPFGVNIPLAYRHAEDHVRVCLEMGVRIVFTAAGSPDRCTRAFKDNGARVVHVVPSARLACKAEAAGCDAVVAEGNEAGGHNGREGLTSLVLWPSVARAVSVPVIAAGGVADGAQMAAAFALGASGVQVGTRFAVSAESTAHPAYKQACLDADGGAAHLYNRTRMPIRSLANAYVERFEAQERAGASDEELAALRGTGRSRLGVFEGDLVEGELVAGQSCEFIDDIPPVQVLMDRILAGFAAAQARQGCCKTP